MYFPQDLFTSRPEVNSWQINYREFIPGFIFSFKLFSCLGHLWTILSRTTWKGLLWNLILGISSVGRTQKQPVILRGFLCLQSLKILLTVEFKSALSGAPGVRPNAAAQGCQRYYHYSIEACWEVEILPWSSWLCSCKKRYNHQILLCHLTHNSVERENPIQDSGDQEILQKLLVEGKKN